MTVFIYSKSFETQCIDWVSFFFAINIEIEGPNKATRGRVNASQLKFLSKWPMSQMIPKHEISHG